MGHSVTLGGDRLGSGKKQKVHLHGYERSTHDLGYLWRNTMAPGTLVPFMKQLALPGDTFDINLNAHILTHPTVGPLFGSYKVQLDVFEAPLRLYQGLLHNNKLGIGMDMASVKLPQMRLQCEAINPDATDYENQQINPSHILSYLGVRGVGTLTGSGAEDTRLFNAIPLLAYWDIYKNYYSNKMEEIGAVIHNDVPTVQSSITSITTLNSPYTGTPETIPIFPLVNGIGTITTGAYIQAPYTGTAESDSRVIYILTAERGWLTMNQLTDIWTDATTEMQGIYTGNLGTLTLLSWRERTNSDPLVTEPTVVTFDLENLDEMREYLLTNMGTSPIEINDATLTPYTWAIDWDTTSNTYLLTQEGLAIKTYQSDLFNNWLNTEWIDGTGGITELTAIDTSSGTFTLDTLNLSKKVYEMLNRIMVSGGTYNDWVESVYDHSPFTRAETPIYHGGLSKELIFQEVISNSASETNTNQPLGTLAGRGVLSNKHKGGQITIRCNEPSYIIGIVSLTPRLDYSTGNDWDVNLQTMDDLHKPQLDEIGFQELIIEQLAWWTTEIDQATGDLTYKSAGKQPAWINYMTEVNKVKGNFAIQNNEGFMVLMRRYQPDLAVDGTITDLTTYIDPAKFNHVFAQTSLDAMNFWTQIAVDITARRKMSAKVMPNL